MAETTSDIPAIKRYRSLGLAVKANDAEAVKEICAWMKSEDRLPEDTDTDKPLSTLLWGAAGTSSPEVMATLVEYGASPSYSLLVKGEEAGKYHNLCVSERAIFCGKKDNIRWLIEQGHVALESSSTDEYTLLMQAIFYRQFDVADYLLSIGADLHASNLRGNTAFHMACAAPVSIDAIEWLVKHMADPNMAASDDAVPAQRLPEIEEGFGREEDILLLDDLFNALEDYAGAHAKGIPYTLPEGLMSRFKPHSSSKPEDGEEDGVEDGAEDGAEDDKKISAKPKTP